MSAVKKCSANSPLPPMVALCVTPLMVIEAVSPLGANRVPFPIIPPSEIELVPTGIDCDPVKPLKVTGIGCTTMLPIESSCWLPTRTVLGLMAVPTADEGLRMCRLALVLWFSVPNAQFSTWLPCAPVMLHVPGPAYAGLMVQFAFVPPGNGVFSDTLFATAAALLLTVIVKPIGFPAVTVAASGVVVTVTTGAKIGGKATMASLKTFVFPPISKSTFLVGLINVVMSKTNWQKIGGFVGTPGFPISIGVESDRLHD